MPKQRTGYVYFDKKRKTWTARLTYKYELGRTRNIKRQVANKTERRRPGADWTIQTGNAAPRGSELRH
jgi:hypothetical protein